jgi:hypothetical protein
MIIFKIFKTRIPFHEPAVSWTTQVLWLLFEAAVVANAENLGQQSGENDVDVLAGASLNRVKSTPAVLRILIVTLVLEVLPRIAHSEPGKKWALRGQNERKNGPTAPIL